MDAAVRELQCSDNGGVLVWFFELLWRAKPLPNADYLYADHLPPVPDTVLLNFSRIQHWYFTQRPKNKKKLASRKRAAAAAAATGGDHSDEEHPQHAIVSDDVNREDAPDGAVVNADDANDEDDDTSGSKKSRTLWKKRGANLTGRAIFGSFCGFEASSEEPGGGGSSGQQQQQTTAQGLTRAEFRAAERREYDARVRSGAPTSMDDTTTIVAMLVCRSKTAQTHGMIESASANGASPRRPSSATTSAPATRTQVLESAGPSTADVKYFNVRALKQLLFHGSLGETALLQNFVRPKASDSTTSAALSTKNETLQVHWQWSSCTVTRHQNIYGLGDGGRSTDERGETFEAGTNTFSSMSGSASIAEPLKLSCNAIAEHVFAVSEQRIVRMSAVFKVDRKNRLMLLFVQSVHCAAKETLFRAPEVACPDALATTLLFAGRHTTVSELARLKKAAEMQQQQWGAAPNSPGTRGSPHIRPGMGDSVGLGGTSRHQVMFATSADPPTSPALLNSPSRVAGKQPIVSPARTRQGRAQRLQKLVAARNAAAAREVEQSGCNSLVYREQVATQKYARLIPTSWRTELERGEKRRATLRSSAYGETVTTAGDGVRSPLAAKQSFDGPPEVSPNAQLRARVAFAEDSDDDGRSGGASPKQGQLMSPRSRDRANRNATRALALAVPGLVTEAVDDTEWSNVSRASKALLHRGASATPYAKRNFASDAARMGVAEAYIGCMPAYSVGKAYVGGTTATRAGPRRSQSTTPSTRK